MLVSRLANGPYVEEDRLDLKVQEDQRDRLDLQPQEGLFLPSRPFLPQAATSSLRFSEFPDKRMSFLTDSRLGGYAWASHQKSLAWDQIINSHSEELETGINAIANATLNQEGQEARCLSHFRISLMIFRR